nr:hypothetical protein [Tanacetum cinerariifolium]
MASAVIFLATGRKFNFSKYIRVFDSMVKNVDSLSKFLMYPCFIQVLLDHQVDDMTTYNTRYKSSALTQKVLANMRRVRKGFVETPLFDPMLVQSQQQAKADVEVNELEKDRNSQGLEILRIKKRVKRLERKKKSKNLGLKGLRRVGADQKVESSSDIVLGAKEDASKQGKIAAIDADEGTTLVDAETDEKEVALDADKGVSAVIAPELVSTAKPTVFDDEDVIMTMAQTLIKLKVKKARILNEKIAQKLHDAEVQKVTARDEQERADMEKALELQRQLDEREDDIDWSAVAEQVKE